MTDRPDTIAIHGGEERNKPYSSLTTPVVFGTSFPFLMPMNCTVYAGNIERPNEYIRYTQRLKWPNKNSRH